MTGGVLVDVYWCFMAGANPEQRMLHRSIQQFEGEKLIFFDDGGHPFVHMAEESEGKRRLNCIWRCYSQWSLRPQSATRKCCQG